MKFPIFVACILISTISLTSCRRLVSWKGILKALSFNHKTKHEPVTKQVEIDGYKLFTFLKTPIHQKFTVHPIQNLFFYQQITNLVPTLSPIRNHHRNFVLSIDQTAQCHATFESIQICQNQR